MASSIQQGRPNINFHKYYDSIFYVVTQEFYQVFLWLYKGGNQYVGDYIKTTPRGMKKLSAREKAVLNRGISPEKFDIPSLYSLLQHTCGLAEDTAHVWNKPQTPSERASLEHTLYLLKESRNALSHEPKLFMQMSETELNQKLSEVRHLCRHVLQEAGQRAKRTSAEIDDSVNRMERALDEMKTKATPSGITAGKFALVAKQEMKRKYQSPASINNFVMPVIQAKGKHSRNEISLKLFPMWRSEDGSTPSTFALLGDPGMGKTSICQYIMKCWIMNSSDICDLQGYDLVIPVHCCQVSTRDLVGYLMQFIEDTIKWCGRDDTQEFLKSLRVLWLVDGFEERTVDARELQKTIERQGSSHFVFITTQLQQEMTMSDSLTSKDTRSICLAHLFGLNDDGISLMIDNVLYEKEKDKVVCEEKRKQFLQDVKMLGKESEVELKVPLKLEFMLNLWLEGKLNKDAGVSLHVLYKTIIEVQCKKLVEKVKLKDTLKEMQITERIKKWMKMLYKIAVDMTLAKEYINIPSKRQQTLEDTAGSLPIHTHEFLSAFLQCNTHYVTGDVSYSFMHNSHQYFLAAQYLSIATGQNSGISQKVKELLEKKIKVENDADQSHIYRVLLHVVSTVAQNLTLEELFVKMLFTLIWKCGDFDVFEVIQYAAFNDVFVQEATKYSDNLWDVYDNSIKAAISLFKYKSPEMIKINMAFEPDIIELHPLLDLVKNKKTMVLLLLQTHHESYHTDDFSDAFVDLVCTEDAKCTMRAFLGKLSLEGCEYLKRMPRLKYLCITITSNEILNQVLLNLQDKSELYTINMVITMPITNTSFSLQHIRMPGFQLTFTHKDALQHESTMRSICNMYDVYYQISICEVEKTQQDKFINYLLVNKISTVEGIHFAKSNYRYNKNDEYAYLSYQGTSQWV